MLQLLEKLHFLQKYKKCNCSAIQILKALSKTLNKYCATFSPCYWCDVHVICLFSLEG